MTGLNDRSTTERSDAGNRSARLAHRPLVPEPVRITSPARVALQSVKSIVTKTFARIVAPRHAPSLTFSWDVGCTSVAPHTVYVATLQREDIKRTIEQVDQYRATGVPPSRIVIVGDYRDLDYQTYAGLKRTGAQLQRVHGSVTDAVRRRVEEELAPYFQNALGMTPPPVFEKREYRYNAPVQLSPKDLEALVARMNDQNYTSSDE